MTEGPSRGAEGAALGAALAVRSLSKTFEGQRALADVDFDVAPGEIHALVGQNGSGKSTLIKILAGFEAPDPGASAMVGDEPFTLGDAAAAAAARLAFVHQDLALIDSMSVMENLALTTGYATGAGHRIHWREERERARQAMALVGSSVKPTAIVGDLPAVQRAAVAIARALVVSEEDGRFLILDEPTASLPRAEAERLFELVRGLAGRGLGIVLVSHHLEEVLGVADRITVLRNGVNVATADASGLDRDALAALIVGREVQEHHSGEREAAGEPALSVRGMRGPVLAGIDFDVAPGEILGVAGIVGSGREELAPLIFGQQPFDGELSIGGRSMARFTSGQAIRAGIALVPADRISEGLIVDMTIQENLTLGDLSPFWRGGRLRHREERADTMRWIDRLGIVPPRPEAPIHTLSGGNQQKVLLAKWLRLDPSVLVLAEPTQGVDVGAKVEIYTAIEQAAASGVAVLVSSSDTEELALLCDRVLVLRRGVVAADLAAGASAEHINELTL